jgi:predicted ATP-grasp superfamily ATP-dependent carboligase
MNVLVTNTRHAQAYAIVRALRPRARKIVVTMCGPIRLGSRLGPAANSRLVDRRFHVPSPVEDWRAGNIRPENTEREEAYVRAVIEICEREAIDTIFPSWDPKVYVFAKNRERFARLGVHIPVPDYATVITPLDKYRSVQAAERAGFPCPRTFLPETEGELHAVAAKLGFPLVLKARFTSAGGGLGIVPSLAELSEAWRRTARRYGPPMVQEYIPGLDKQNFYMVLDRDGRLLTLCSYATHRLFLRIYRNSSAASQAVAAHPFAEDAARFAASLGWWGSITVQTKVDPRDGRPKLMEVNPRMGRHLWLRTALGVDEPNLCLEIGRGQAPTGSRTYTPGTMLLNPVEDVMTLAYSTVDRLAYRIRTGWLGRAPLDPLSPPMTLRELARSYVRTYLGDDPKVFDPYFEAFPRDPLPGLLQWLVHLSQVLRATKHLGA